METLRKDRIILEILNSRIHEKCYMYAQEQMVDNDNWLLAIDSPDIQEVPNRINNKKLEVLKRSKLDEWDKHYFDKLTNILDNIII